MKRILLALAASFSASLTVSQAQGSEESASHTPAQVIARIEGQQSPNRQGLDPFSIEELMRKYHVPGVSVAVIKDFAIHWAKGYGVADVATGAPVQPDTMFQAASISKPVTAMALLTLAQSGRIPLDADINGSLKSWKVPANHGAKATPVTARALLSHTSGADDGFGFPGYEPSAPQPTLLQILAGAPPSNVGPVLFERAPFAAYKYSGGGFVIVQLAMTDTLSKPFTEIMHEQVLAPLSMKDSSFEQPLPASRDAQAARAHSAEGASMGAKAHVYPEQAAAGLWTTPGDLARFVIEIQTALRGPQGRVLSRALAQEMVTPVGVGPFAVGLTVDHNGEGWYFGHGGSNWGFRCKLTGHLRKGYGVVVMTNADSGAAIMTEIEARVAAAYSWDSLDKPIPR